MANSVGGIPASLNASTPWERARLEFVFDPIFSPEERNLLETGSLETLQAAIVAWDKEHSQESTTRKLGNRLKPIISGLGVFGQALDVFAQVEPKGILAAIWGTIRVLLAAGGRLLGAFEAIVDQMAKLGPSLQRLEIISAVHANSERLDKAVFQVFHRYLECVKTVRLIFKIEKPNDLLQRLKEKIVKARRLITYQESFAESLREVELSCLQAEKEAGLADTQAASKFYKEQKTLLDQANISLQDLQSTQNDSASEAQAFYRSQSKRYGEMISLVEEGQRSSSTAFDALGAKYEKIASSLATFQNSGGPFGKEYALELYSQFATQSQSTTEGLLDRLTNLFNEGFTRADDLEERFINIEAENKQFQQEQRQRWQETDREKLSEQRRKIEEWLSPFNFLATQDDLFEKAKASPTANWLISHPVFQHWSEGVQWQLRLYGEAGVGKTMLSSLIVKYLQEKFPSARRPVLCLYMNYKEDKMHTSEHLFGSLLRQLVQIGGAQRPLPKELSESYERAMSIRTKAKFGEIKKILRKIMSSYERVYLLLDALDECSLRYRIPLLQDLGGLDQDRLSLMITERPDDPVDTRGKICTICHQPDKKEYYHCNICKGGDWDVCLDCRAKGAGCNDEKHSLKRPYDRIGGQIKFNVVIPIDDLKGYVKREMAKEFGAEGDDTWDPQFPHEGPYITRFARKTRKKAELLQKIQNVIAGKADGRFLFARLYWESIKTQLSIADIRETLKNLPEQLSDLYEQNVQRVRGQEDSGSRELAFRVLSRVFFAKRPLSLAELQHMLATRPGDKDYDTERDNDSEDILQSTAGLISIEAEGMAVRLSHQTLEQYFTNDMPNEFWQAQLEMANECLTVIDYAFSSSIGGKDNYRARYPLAAYSSQHWGDHVQSAAYDDDVRGKAMLILKDSTRVQTLVKAAWQTDANTFNSWDAWKGIHALHVSAWFGMDFAIYELFESAEPIDITEPTFKQTPLIYACRKGQFQTVSYLISLGADVNWLSARGSSPLFETVEQNSLVFGALLDTPSPGKSLQVNSRHPRESGRTPLMMAIHAKNKDLVYKLLGRADVDINARDRNGQTALILAARLGLYDVAEVLLQDKKLERNAADFKVKRTALICAAEYNRAALVRLLLDHGVDPNLKDRLGGTALMRGIDKGRKSVVDTMLEDPRVDKQCQDIDGRGLLHVASANGNPEILTTLHRDDLELNLQDSNGMTPLHEAARCGKSEAVEFLLTWNARTDIEDASKRTASIIAWQYGFETITALLRAKTSSNGTVTESIQAPSMQLPAWALVRHAKVDLLKHMIGLNDPSLCETEPGTGNTVLHIAILTEQLDILQLLLIDAKRIGLSIDAANRHLRTPLHLAVINNSLPAVSLLLSHSASPSIPDIWEASPLYIAVQDKRNLIALRLIEAGAAIDSSRQSDVQRLFFKAVENGSVKAATALLASGADKNGRTLDDGLTAYQIAKKEDVEMQRFLKKAKTFTVEEMGLQQLPVRRRETGLKDSVANGLGKIHE